MTSITLEHVSKTYGDGVLAVDDLSVTVPDSVYCCLLGPSGCGKSTVLRMIAGHEVATSGVIRFGDLDVTGLQAAQRDSSLMFQDYALFPHMTVEQNVAYGLKIRGVAKRDRLDRANDMLENLGLADHAGKMTNEISGGQRQRVALARSLILEPSVLLLDEPLSALDRFVRHQMRGELRAIQQKLGLTFIHVTHSQDEAMALADLIVVMRDGKIEQAGNAREIYTRPRTPFVAEFMGGHNVLIGTVEPDPTSMKTRLGGHQVQYAGKRSSGEVTALCLDINDLSLVIDSVAAGYDSVSGQAEVIEYSGRGGVVTIVGKGGLHLTAEIPADALDSADLKLGDIATLQWHPDSTFELDVVEHDYNPPDRDS